MGASESWKRDEAHGDCVQHDTRSQRPLDAKPVGNAACDEAGTAACAVVHDDYQLNADQRLAEVSPEPGQVHIDRKIQGREKKNTATDCNRRDLG